MILVRGVGASKGINDSQIFIECKWQREPTFWKTNTLYDIDCFEKQAEVLPTSSRQQ